MDPGTTTVGSNTPTVITVPHSAYPQKGDLLQYTAGTTGSTVPGLFDSSYVFYSGNSPARYIKGLDNANALKHEAGHAGMNVFPWYPPVGDSADGEPVTTSDEYMRMMRDLHTDASDPEAFDNSLLVPTYTKEPGADYPGPVYSLTPEEYVNAGVLFKDEYYNLTGKHIKSTQDYRDALEWAHDPRNASRLTDEGLRFLRTVGVHENIVNATDEELPEMLQGYQFPEGIDPRDNSKHVLQVLEEVMPIVKNDTPSYRDFANNYRQKQYV